MGAAGGLGRVKHKRFDHRNWSRAESDSQVHCDLPGSVLVDYWAGPVTQPLIRPFGDQQLTLLDSGFRWIYVQPTGRHHALTVMLDAAGRPVQLYVDTALDSGLDPDGWPYMTDLYLDVLAVCDTNWQVTATQLKDEDEWWAAKQTGELSPEHEHAALAWAEAERVVIALQRGDFAPLAVVREYLAHSSEHAP